MIEFNPHVVIPLGREWLMYRDELERFQWTRWFEPYASQAAQHIDFWTDIAGTPPPNYAAQFARGPQLAKEPLDGRTYVS